ncbi:transmembrane protein, putative (macronuclear) [Tetrahymena thermophila SB210]|uniref:Transmembrane protein, putative n=1 Tax=Tetrahymena thermophila (strain SB210) TaxID=312017 RepID=I7M7M2_TETTS|nr:transmembrane protein, putative [Tetrahymena thermophila SB210]EAR94211.2 transmembrane protein, putative [Tetrahymena thermophila SB210]|eukprot:XP_001014456.2 transmembrane protein, putative [Tetrahymena thermophila SB210]
MKHFISGYFIFDITFMLYIDRSSNDLYIYLLLLLGGTALDLVILNDIYIFDRHNSKVTYQSQINGGFAFWQFLDTGFLTILIIYRLFRMYSVAKKWLPQFKTTYQTLNKEINTDEYLSLVSKESSQEETDINSPDIFTNNQAPPSQFNNLNETQRSEINTLQFNITETKQREYSVSQSPQVNSQNGQSKETKVQGQITNKNQATPSLKYSQSRQQVQSDNLDQQLQKDQVQAEQPQKIKAFKSEINQESSGQQVLDNNINKKLKGKEFKEQQSTSQEYQNDSQKKINTPLQRNLNLNQQSELAITQIDDIQNKIQNQQVTITETQKNSNQNKKQQKKKFNTKVSLEQTNNLLEEQQGEIIQHKQSPAINIKPISNFEQQNNNVIKRVQNDELQIDQKKINYSRKQSFKNQGISTIYTRNNQEYQYHSSPLTKQSTRNPNNPLNQAIKQYKTQSNNEEFKSEKKNKVLEKPNKQIFYIQKQNILQQQQQKQLDNNKNSDSGIQNIQGSQSNNVTNGSLIQNQLLCSNIQFEKDIEKTQQNNICNPKIVEQKVEQITTDKELQSSVQESQNIEISLNGQQNNSYLSQKNEDIQQKLACKQSDADDQEIQIINLGISSFNESNGENSSPYLSPKNKETCVKNDEKQNSEISLNQNMSLMIHSSDKNNLVNLQNKSQRKFSYDQDDESSSEENTERENQQIYKEDTHFEKTLQQNSPQFQVQANQQQVILNPTRKLPESKYNKPNKKSTTSRQQANISKSPLMSPSNNDQANNSLAQQENQNSTCQDYEIIQSTQPCDTVELRSKTDTLAYLQNNQASLNLDLTNKQCNQNGQDGLKSTEIVKDSWDSVNNILLKEDQENDSNQIDYFANPLLEALSLPFRSPNIYAASPTTAEKQNIVSSFNGLIFQQISNWNEQQIQNSQTPEIFQTTSNTLSPKQQSNYQALSDNQNEKAKKRKSTNVNSEDLVSDQDKQHKAPAWRIISGEDENSSYEEYEKKYNQDPILQQDSNLEQLSDSKSQIIQSKNQFELKTDLSKDSQFQTGSEQVQYVTEEKDQKDEIVDFVSAQQTQSEEEQKEKTNQESLYDQSHQFEELYSNNQLLADLNASLLKFENKLSTQQQDQQNLQLSQNEEPLIIEIKGQNGKIFEIKISKFSEFENAFDEQCQNNDMNKEDILAAKINVLTSIVNSSPSTQNTKFIQEATILLSQTSLEYTLNIIENEFPQEQQLVDSIRNSGENIFNYCQFYELYNQQQQLDANSYNQSFFSPIQSGKIFQQKYIDEHDQQINLPEFNLFLENTHQGDSMINNVPNFMFPNYLDFSRNQSFLQANIGNTSPLQPSPYLISMARQNSLKQQAAANQRVSHIYPQSVADIDSPKSDMRKDQQPISHINSFNNKGLQSEIQLQSPISKNFVFQPIPKYNSQQSSQIQHAFNNSNSSQQMQFQHNAIMQMASQQSIQTSSDKLNNMLISSSSKKNKQSNQVNNGLFDQWKFNPSSLINTPLQQSQLMHHINSDSSLTHVNSQIRGQRIWQPHTPYLLEGPTPNLLKKPPTPQISSANNLFSQDLLNQLAQLGQPVK